MSNKKKTLFTGTANLSPGFKKILSNTGFLFGERVFNMGLSLFVGIWVARYLGAEKFGLLQYVFSLIGLVTAIASVGTTQIVIRDLVQGSGEKEGKILGTSFVLMLIAGFITAIGIIGVGFWLNDEVFTRWLIVIASVNLVLQAFNAFDYWFQSKVLSKYSVYARTIAQVFSSLLKVAFILLSLNLIYFAFAVIAAGIVKALIYAYSYRKQGSKLKEWQFDKGYAKNLLKNTWPLILSGISVAIYMKIDQVMLKGMVSDAAVGNYAVAVRVSELWYFIPMAIASSVFPSFIQAKKDSTEKYYRRLQYLYDVMAGMAIAIAIPMTFLSDPIINFLFGSEYSMGGSVLAVHIWAGVFVFLGVARSKWIINENLQRYGMIFTLAGAIANVLLNFWLIPIMGIMGAAWATVISYIISAWLTGLVFQKTRKSFYMQGLAILRSLLIYPVISAFFKIYNEAKANK